MLPTCTQIAIGAALVVPGGGSRKMLPSWRLARGSACSLWTLSRCVSGAAHTRRAPKRAARARAKGKRVDQWTPEEVGQRLRVLEEQVEGGHSPHPRQLALLLPPIRHLRDSQGLSRILEVVQRSDVGLDEGLGSSLVSGLAEDGRIADIRAVLQQMLGRLRVQGVASILSLACREVNSDLALEYLAGWDVAKPLPDGLVGSLVELARVSGRLEVIDRLLSILRETRQTVGVACAAELRLWAQSQPQPFICEDTTINSRGVCSSCGGQLEKALTEADHRQLLGAVTTAVHSEGLGFSPELISNLSRLQEQLSTVSTPYRVVVDGLNVSRVASKNFSIMQVMDIVNQLIGTLGGPVLVVARKHLAKEMDELPLFYSSMPQDFHVFTTHINEISDDVCVIYAALTTGPDCYFVSNDHMSDNAALLPSEDSRLFSTWQDSRQITVQPTRIRLLYPPDHSRLAQCSQSGWHLPLSPAPAPTPQTDSWLLDGRRRWEHMEATQPWAVPGVPHWLCIRRTA